MFGLFKKKTPEEKHGRSNYLKNPNDFVANHQNWILMLSAVYMEFKNIETDRNDLHHDLLAGYEETLTRLDLSIINGDMDLDDKSDLKERMKNLTRCWPETIEMDLYDVLSAETQEALDAFLEEYHEDDYTEQDILKEVWNAKEQYQEGFHYRIGLIIKTMWEIRMFVAKKQLSPPKAWKHLYVLADLLKPMMTMFSSWEELLENQRLFIKLENPGMDIGGTIRDFGVAATCLVNIPHSPLHKVPYDFGIDKNYPYNLTNHSYLKVKQVDMIDTPELKPLAELMKQEDKQPLWGALDALSTEQNYQITPIITGQCDLKNFDEEDAIEIPQLSPDVHYAWLMRGNYYFSLAWEARGEGTANTVGEDNYRLFHERLSYAFNDYYKAYQLRPDDPSVWADLDSVLSLTDIENCPIEQEEIQQKIAEYGLNHSYAVRIIASGLEERWGGSYEQAIAWANDVINNTERGAATRLIPFIVALERYDYLRCFEEEEGQAEQMFTDKELAKSLDVYFDELLENMHKDPHRIASYLSFWYQETANIEKLRAVGRSMTPGYYLAGPWSCYSERKITCMMNWIRSI